MAGGPLNWLDSDYIDMTGSGARFVLTGEDDGSWTVFDQATNLPAIWNDEMLFSLTFEVADDLVETMNQLILDVHKA